MDKILVAYGRASEATGLVGLAVGEQLARAGLHVDVRPFSRAQEPSGYRAVILGSALQEGRWERCALDYVTRHAAILTWRPTWLYQLARSTRPVNSDARVASLFSRIAAAEPVTFHPALLGSAFGSRVPAIAHDHQSSDELGEWTRVRRWGWQLADELPVLTMA